jgi:hypothetical protein
MRYRGFPQTHLTLGPQAPFTIVHHAFHPTFHHALHLQQHSSLSAPASLRSDLSSNTQIYIGSRRAGDRVEYVERGDSRLGYCWQRAIELEEACNNVVIVLDELHSHVGQLLDFGARKSWSPDGSIEKSIEGLSGQYTCEMKRMNMPSDRLRGERSWSSP